MKKRLTLALALALAFALAGFVFSGCGSDDGGGDDKNHPITGVEFVTEDFSLVEGEQSDERLRVRILPMDATNHGVTFESDRPDVAVVNGDGYVVGVAPGVAKITAVSNDNKSIKSEPLTVTVTKVVEVTEIDVDLPSFQLAVNESRTFKAKVKPANATYKNLIWTSTDKEILSVEQNEDGSSATVTGVKDGLTWLNVATEKGKAKKSVSVQVKWVKVTGIETNTYIKLIVGDTYKMPLEIIPSNASNKGVDWSSSNDYYASVFNGTVEAKHAGTATITATTVDGGFTSKCRVEVLNKTW